MDNESQRWLLRRYKALLVALLLLLGFYPVLRHVFEGRFLLDVLFTIVFAAVFVVVFARGRVRIAAVLLGIPSILAGWVHFVLPGVDPVIPGSISHLLAVAFLGFSTVAILREVYSAEEISYDSVYGALAAYLLIGLTFGHLFSLLELLAPGSYAGPHETLADLTNHDRRRFILTYFSFVTLTTTGYGDVTPASDTARSWAMIEAVVGQFYIAVLIGGLISKGVSQALARKK